MTERIHKDCVDAATNALGIVKYSELCKHGSTVVIYLLACRLIALTARTSEHRAQRSASAMK